MALINKLEAIGDAIRSKTGGTEELTLDEMATAISSLSTGSTGTIQTAMISRANGTTFDLSNYVDMAAGDKFILFYSHTNNPANNSYIKGLYLSGDSISGISTFYDSNEGSSIGILDLWTNNPLVDSTSYIALVNSEPKIVTSKANGTWGVASGQLGMYGLLIYGG